MKTMGKSHHEKQLIGNGKYYLKLLFDFNITFLKERPNAFEDGSNFLWNWRLSSFSTLKEGTKKYQSIGNSCNWKKI